MTLRLLSPISLLAAAATGLALDPLLPDPNPPPALAGMNLFWSDEFNVNGKPDPKVWSYETGFVRNQELQWYQADNASCIGGVLLIEGRKQQIPNPKYVAGSSDWKTSRQKSEYTSSSLTTSGRKTWQFAHVEVRARLDGQAGTWPAIWTLGSNGEWPTNGEVDILEFYPAGGTPSLHANVAWGTATRWSAAWNSKTKPLSGYVAKDPDWLKKFHLWTMDWTKDSIRLGLDGTVMNAVSLKQTVNNDGTNPFQDRSQYVLLNLALGGNGGDPSKAIFPMKFEVDYVRVYQPSSTSIAPRESPGFKLYPITGTHSFELERDAPLPSDRLELLRLSGEHVTSVQLQATNVLDLSNQAPGIYVVRLRSLGGESTVKILR